jgi:hypothetical protein
MKSQMQVVDGVVQRLLKIGVTRVKDNLPLPAERRT